MHVLDDLRIAVRTLLRRPGFTAIAVLTLALGIGANAAIFGFVDAIAFRSLPVAEPERLVAIFPTDREGEVLNFSFPDYRELRAGLRSIERLAAFSERPVSAALGRRHAAARLGDVGDRELFPVARARGAAGPPVFR